MTISLHASSAARLSVTPLTGPLPRVPHLVAPEHASIGDIIGVFGGITNQPDSACTKQIFCEVAYRKGVLEPENAFIDEMSDADAAVFKEITAVPFCGIDHDRIVRQARMDEPGQPFQIHLVQFADALIYVHPDWLHGTWGRQPGHGTSRPLMIMLEGARSQAEAAQRLEKTKRYMKLFRSALPPAVRTSQNRRLELPRVDDFLASGGSNHAFVR
tara:strand:+ start:618 stop:1262 length:645 start_codon:yes stop_codon:yes gene_type:complete